VSLIVYTRVGCPWCRDVLALLREKNVPFEERDKGNPEYLKELIQKSGQDQTPTLDLDGAILADTDAEAVEKFLKEKGILT